MRVFLARVRRAALTWTSGAMASCGAALVFLAAGARMDAWEQFGWPSMTLAFLLFLRSARKECRRLLDLAKTQNDLLADQHKQLRIASDLLRDQIRQERS